MNRNDEFFDLVNQLNDTPPELEDTVQRAQVRAGKRKVWGWVMAPLGTVAAVFALFVVLVNTSPAFAQALSDVPVLGDLAAAVQRWSSLTAAVENDYVQVIGQTQVGDGFSVTVEYAIIDRQQLNIFYRLDNEDENQPYCILMVGVEPVRAGYVMWNGRPDRGELSRLTMENYESRIPDRLTLTMEVTEWVDEVTWKTMDRTSIDKSLIQTVTFELEFDPTQIEEGESYPIGQWLELDGQRVYADHLEVYPSTARLFLADDPDNELVLTGLYCYLEDENGNRYEQWGAHYAISPRSSFSFVSKLDIGSPWFAQPEELTLHITGTAWGRRDELEDETQGHMVTVDLETGAVEGLPEGWTYKGSQDWGYAIQFTFGTTVQPDGETEYDFYATIDSEGNMEEIVLGTTKWSTFAEPISVEIK